MTRLVQPRIVEITPAVIADLRALAAALEAADGHPPFTDAALHRLGRDATLLEIGDESTGAPAAAALIVGSTFEVTVHPARRRQGLASALIEAVLARAEVRGTRPLGTWAHGDLAGSQALASRYGFAPVREVHQMALDLHRAAATPPTVAGIRIRPYRQPDDLQPLARANRAAFADHPDQGSVGVDDIAALQREPWFDPAALLVAEDEADGSELVGFVWIKRASPAHTTGEIYVLGVVPAWQGRGLGRALLGHALAHLVRTRATQATLYVDATSTAARALYGNTGFEPISLDVHYRRE